MAATRLLPASGFDQGRNREQARSHSFRRRPEQRTPWRRALLPTAPQAGAAHCPPLLSGSEDPSHRTPAAGRARSLCKRFLWERPWPRRGCCRPLASIKAAIASKLAPTVFGAGPSKGPRGGGHCCRQRRKPAPRTAHRCCRGQKTLPTRPRLRPWIGHIPSHTTPASGRARSLGERSSPRGSGLGRDAAVAVSTKTKGADGAFCSCKGGIAALLTSAARAAATGCASRCGCRRGRLRG